MNTYEFRYNYPLVVRTQALMPGIDARLVDPKKVEISVVPDDSPGHIQVRKWEKVRVQEKNKKGEVVTRYVDMWSAWENLCPAKCEGSRKVSGHALAARPVCPACLQVHKSNPDYPENRLLSNWEQGGTKVFGHGA
jgi:hypothetical protein